MLLSYFVRNDEMKMFKQSSKITNIWPTLDQNIRLIFWKDNP